VNAKMNFSTFVNTEINLHFPRKTGNLLTSWTAIIFSSGTPLHRFADIEVPALKKGPQIPSRLFLIERGILILMNKVSLT
jgi:hypothetical protein